tara:strand:- start:2768 stop:4408 length:1641 start_codon:yes stop_codon:yes gene_type:complete
MKGLRLKSLSKEKIFYKLLFIILPLISFFFSLYQLNHQYDGHHHGVIFSITEDFLNGKVPYQDFLPHYGIFFVYLNSIFIKIFSDSIYGTYFLLSISKGLILFMFAMIIKEKFNEKITATSMFVMFMLQPFVDTPWPDYLFFFLLLLSIYILITSKNNYSLFTSGIIYSLAGLTKDNFIIFLFICLILFGIFLYFLKAVKKKTFYDDFINIYWIVGFLIPLIVFGIYLKHNLIFDEYLNHFKIGTLATRYYCTSIVDSFFLRSLDCGFISLKQLFENSYTKIFTEPYWLFFLIIIITNMIFIINIIFFDKEKNISKEKKSMILISFLSLILFSNNLYFLTIQKLFTGVSIGFIVMIYLIQKLKSPVDKYVIYTFFFVFLINGLQFAKTSNNPIYPTFSKKYNDKSSNITFLKFKKLSKVEWLQLNDFKSLTTNIKEHCPFIKYSTNLTNDVFYRVILKEKFELLNFIPFGPRNKFITEMYKSFDKDYYLKLDKKIYDQNIIIAVDNTLKSNIDFKNNEFLYLVKHIRYNNYGASFINIYLPKDCKI